MKKCFKMEMYFIYWHWKIKEDSKEINKDLIFLITLFLPEHVIRKFSSPILVALYMFSIGKAEPRPYSKTLDRAGMSWVVVTNTFTQLGLEQDKTDAFILRLIYDTLNDTCYNKYNKSSHGSKN